MNEIDKQPLSSKLPVDLSGRVQREHGSFPVGGGSFGAVYKGRLDGTIVVAIKVPLMHVAHDPKAPNRLAREMESWSRAKHKNVQPLLGYCKNLSPHAPTCFVSPWMENGTARSFIKKYPTTNRITLLKEIADGLTHLHKCKIIHGDIRGDNILISANGRPLINDFGLSRCDGGVSASSSQHGALPWMPPEWVEPTKFKLTVTQIHDFPLDVWSYGMTILELMTEGDPYAEYQSGVVLSKAISLGTLPRKPEVFVDDEMWGLCLRIWKKERKERPKMNAIFGVLTEYDNSFDVRMPKFSNTDREDKTLEQIRDELFEGSKLLVDKLDLLKDRSALRGLSRELKRIDECRLQLSMKHGIFNSSYKQKKELLGQAQKFRKDATDFVNHYITVVEPLAGQPGPEDEKLARMTVQETFRSEGSVLYRSSRRAA